MNLQKLKYVGLILFLSYPLNSSATVVLENYKNTNEVTIKIVNEIKNEDIVEFKNALEKIETEKKILHMNSIQLNSIGGSGTAGQEIGRLIRSKRLNTYIAKKSQCNSACVYILMGGVIRYPFGKVGVHRTTFTKGFEIDDSETEMFIKYNIKQTKAYAESMGMTNQLVDAILNTESWKIRNIDEKEKREWQVFGTDRLTEERLFTSIAKEMKIERDNYISIFRTNYTDCLDDARNFERTIYDCAKTRKVKVNYWNVLRMVIYGAY